MTAPAAVDAALLRSWPLPPPAAKSARGTCLVVGGSAVTPGAVMLSALGALRAGAGKAQVATVRSAAPHLAIAVPELLVAGLDETADGHLDPSAAAGLERNLRGASSVLVGPGALDVEGTGRILAEVVRRSGEAIVVIDAKALDAVAADPSPLVSLAGRGVLTPNIAEAAALLGQDDLDEDDLAAAAVELAGRHGLVVAGRGAVATIAAPDGRTWACGPLPPGLACPGSGDVLAGVVGGLAARCGEPALATVHGIAAHAEAGARLVRRVGHLGFLARELLDELPGALAAGAPAESSRTPRSITTVPSTPAGAAMPTSSVVSARRSSVMRSGTCTAWRAPTGNSRIGTPSRSSTTHTSWSAVLPARR